jgi:SAM-dependent methyltransferase
MRLPARLFRRRPAAHTIGMTFQDHFSTQADAYARFRPIYPDALYAWLASRAPARELAWDCGTGSGQAAVALAAHFTRVIASDPSREQIAHAAAHARVCYMVASAEQPPAEALGADLVTVAQALHWFDFARFYPALERVLKPGGLFAAWGYGPMRILPAVDAIVTHYRMDVVGPYWPPERRHIENGYRSIPFPLAELAVPEFEMTASWTLEDLHGYLDTWSATRRYLKARGQHPLLPLRPALAEAWGGVPARQVAWPLFLRLGRCA